MSEVDVTLRGCSALCRTALREFGVRNQGRYPLLGGFGGIGHLSIASDASGSGKIGGPGTSFRGGSGIAQLGVRVDGTRRRALVSSAVEAENTDLARQVGAGARGSAARMTRRLVHGQQQRNRLPRRT
ncbi:hypothetical protein [Actinoplanes sp. TFC3]|uniref:hypothetical protein n=1 Tax=Actinoplanes sp. TFC3 TaxID=1710355 RepID=UPI0012906629|nr:hypothetical protein [Actinoplanes sp. TFC3]